ncbi:MAG: hypothetical protein LCH81_01810, partial [Bacteroidetes bacterium]|nr:hypothetical protein [Bacteroidota bacterium]
MVISWDCPSASISYAGSPFCTNDAPESVTLVGQGEGTYSASAGLALDANTGEINPALSTPGSYTVTYSYSGGCETTTNVVVNAAPTCSITGNNGPLCPSSTFSYTGPAGMAGYAWSVSGNASITSGGSTQTVTISTGANCNASFTLTLEVTHANGCTSTCDKTVNVVDNTAPVINTAASGQTVQCDGAGNTAALNAWLSSNGGAAATDGCGGAI